VDRTRTMAYLAGHPEKFWPATDRCGGGKIERSRKRCLVSGERKKSWSPKTQQVKFARTSQPDSRRCLIRGVSQPQQGRGCGHPQDQDRLLSRMTKNEMNPGHRCSGGTAQIKGRIEAHKQNLWCRNSPNNKRQGMDRCSFSSWGIIKCGPR
jgi:hypothetical protein